MPVWIKRTLRTFIQTAVGYMAVELSQIDFTADKQTLKACLTGLLISSVSAGICAVMNFKEE